MPLSKVYFTDFHTPYGGPSMLEKFQKLIEKSGFDTIDFSNKFVAIKMHFGELGNVSYLRHNYVRVLVDMVRARGGKPFLVDCNTLYVGSRKNALDHLDCAYQNGFNPLTVGCHVLIGDGLKGTDETLVDISGEYVKQAKIGAAVMDADIVISLSHFKGHEDVGFGGAIKNIGMGCGSRAGKMEMHYSGKPAADKDVCIGCKSCAKICAHNAIEFDAANKAAIVVDRCVGCGRCIGVCPVDAIEPMDGNSSVLLNRRMAEYAWAVLKDRPHFHISHIVDVSPYCDCHSENDAPIIPDVGMFASFDPVAIDKACVDACNAQPAMPGSAIEKAVDHDHEIDRFHAVSPNAEWRSCIEHCVKLGLGTEEYDLIRI